MEAFLSGPLGSTSLGSTRLTIGRASDNNLVVKDVKASAHHAEILPEGQSYSIVDLGSSNGTFVNEQQIFKGSPRQLQPGDKIRIGDTTFSFASALPSSQPAPFAHDATQLAAPSSPNNPANYRGNTSYGYGAMQPGYNETIPAQLPYESPQPPYMMPTQQDSLIPPAPPTYLASEAQVPTYISSSYTPTNQVPSYTEPPSGPQGQGAFALPQPQFTRPPEPQKPRSNARTIILAIIALVIILAAAGGFFLIHGNQVAQQNTNATATAQTRAHTNATSTAQVVATQNVLATRNAVATAQVTSHYPPFTNLALFDPLTSSNSQWDTGSECQFTASGYQVSIARAGYFQWCLNTQQIGEMAFQATMVIQQGDCGGLMYRFVDANNFYYFEVCQNGTYNSIDLVNGKSNTLYSNFQSSAAIKQGTGQQNVIAVVVQGNTINMYVNGKNIDSATSNALTSSTFTKGQLGMIADDINSSTAVTYTSALVWTAS
jgi:hypothetical protein